MTELVIGKIYCLGFPGIAARVLPNPSNTWMEIGGERQWLIETILRKDRWWCNRFGDPNNYCSPQMFTPDYYKRKKDIRNDHTR